MSQLPEQYDRIRREAIEEALEGDVTSNVGRLIDAVRDAVERCYALSQKPQRELTDAECYKIWTEIYGGEWDANDWAGLNNGTEVVRCIADCYQRKQREPETVKFRAARMKDNHERVAMCRTDDKLNAFWEWLEPAQEYEVTLL